MTWSTTAPHTGVKNPSKWIIIWGFQHCNLTRKTHVFTLHNELYNKLYDDLHYKTNCFNANISHVISFLNLIGWGSCGHWKSSPQKVAVVNYFIIYGTMVLILPVIVLPTAMNTAAVCAGDVIFMMSWLIKGDMSCLNCSFLPSRMTEIPQFKSIKIKCLGNAHTTLANATYNGHYCKWLFQLEQIWAASHLAWLHYTCAGTV